MGFRRRRSWYTWGVKNWSLRETGVQPHEPQILSSGGDARTVLLNLPSGEELQEHEVHERARLIVVDGDVEVTTADGETVRAGDGHLFEFEPGERHTVIARADARLLLMLTPWPGDGHPGTLSLEEKSEARERAAEHSRS